MTNSLVYLSNIAKNFQFLDMRGDPVISGLINLETSILVRPLVTAQFAHTLRRHCGRQVSPSTLLRYCGIDDEESEVA